jgi:oxaloacetate decarboxylase alpha subunit
MSSPRAAEVLASPPEQPTIEELRKRHGTGDDDDELLFRALMPASDLEKMRAAGPLKRHFPLLSSPELDQAAHLMKVVKTPLVQFTSDSMSLTLRR